MSLVGEAGQLYPSDASCRIVDLSICSELAMRRSEYAAIFQRDGFEGLLSALEQKIGRHHGSHQLACGFGDAFR